MIQFLRRFFGMKEVSGTRKVAGRPDNIRAKDVHFIKDSNKRLVALEKLLNRFKDAPQAQKVKSILDRTQRIHTYLVSRGKVHELELFHVQNTDHFLNTFNVILDAQEQHQPKTHQKLTATRTGSGSKRIVLKPSPAQSLKMGEVRQRNLATTQQVMADTPDRRTRIPILAIPEIAINTYSKIAYLKDDTKGDFTIGEIGYTSSEEEKNAFVLHLSAALGLEDASYAGNALVYLQAMNQVAPSAELLPVIHWNNCPYAVNLDEKRILPVITFRKRS